jgi:outer membrane protein assembly factor BamB
MENMLLFFFASEGLYCYTVDGKLMWKKDLGLLDSGFFVAPEAQWGFASSPIIHKDLVIVQCDVQKNSFIAAFDIKTGKEIWRTMRNEIPTWGTPTVYKQNDITQIIVNGYQHIGSYDFKDGKEIWKMRGGGDIPVPTPIVAHNLIFINSAHGKMSPIYAIKTNAKGDISLQGQTLSNESIVWSVRKGGSYLLSPLVYGDYLYNCQINGDLSCYWAKTGKLIYEKKLGRESFSASAVAADDKLYFSSENGEVFVVQAGPDYKLLAKNSMNEICMATPAISGDMMFFRTQSQLVAISE